MIVLFQWFRCVCLHILETQKVGTFEIACVMIRTVKMYILSSITVYCTYPMKAEIYKRNYIMNVTDVLEYLNLDK